MQSTLLASCLLLFIVVFMPLSVLAHELGHVLAMIGLHHNGKPIIVCPGCKMTVDKTGKYHRPASSWIIRWPRLLLIVTPSAKAALFGITYGQEKLNTLQRFPMILAGPLVSLGLAVASCAGACLLLYVVRLSWTSLDALWRQITESAFYLCSMSTAYNGIFFLLSILPIPKQKGKPLPPQRAITGASGTDGYQLFSIWRENRRKPNEKRR